MFSRLHEPEFERAVASRPRLTALNTAAGCVEFARGHQFKRQASDAAAATVDDATDHPGVVSDEQRR
jgi:hypothetical protein